MANKLTLLDLAKRSGNDETVGLVESLIQDNALLNALPFRQIDGISYRYKVRTGLPTVGWRAYNEGTAHSKSKIEQLTVETKILEGRSIVDFVEANDAPDPAAFRDEEDRGFLAAMSNKFNLTALTGNASTNPREISGIETILNSTAIATCIALTGATGSSGSVIAVSFEDVNSPQGKLPGVEGILAGQGMPKGMDLGVQLVLDSGGTNSYPAYVTNFLAQMGLAIYDTRSIGRIANISSVAKPSVSNLNALKAAMYPYKPSAFFMPNTIYGYVADLKTSIYYGVEDTDIFGRVETFAGIPLLIDDNLTMTETAI